MTVRRLAQAPLAAATQDALVRAAVDSFASYGLVVVDANGAIASWSTGAERLFGYPRTHAEGQPVSLLLDVAAEPGGIRDIASRIKTVASKTGLCDLSFRHMDGRLRILPASVSMLRGESEGGGFAILVTDAMVADRGTGDDCPPSEPRSVDFSAQRPEESVALFATETADRPEPDAARLRLLQRLIVAQEEERLRIAQNLHDDLGQQLTALRLTLATLRSSVDAQPEISRTADAALTLLTSIDDALDFLAWELRPAALDELGLARVIEAYAAEWARHSSIVANFHSGLTESDRFAPEIEATVYRITQEALNNVAKHSQARNVNVILEPRAETLVLVVEDDGVGCAANDVSDRTMGLSGMRERAAAVGGTIEFEPTPRGGTTVLARIPMVDLPRLAAHSVSLSAPAGQDEANSARTTPTDAVLAALRGRLLDLQNAVGARDEFIATVAHELRNPISPLVFQVRLALDKTDQMASSGEALTVPWVQAQLRRIEQRLHRVLETLDRLLDVSRLSTGRIDLQLEPLDLTHIAQEVVSGFEAEFAVARCPVSVSTNGNTTGSWDRMRLEQICRNLISNAIRFGAGQPIVVALSGDEGQVRLSVRDRGVGVARSLHARIFERFERGVEQRSGGFGIGLWVVKNICMAMGGEVKVESELGEGACFTVTLPRRIERTSVPQETA